MTGVFYTDYVVFRNRVAVFTLYLIRQFRFLQRFFRLRERLFHFAPLHGDGLDFFFDHNAELINMACIYSDYHTKARLNASGLAVLGHGQDVRVTGAPDEIADHFVRYVIPAGKLLRTV